MIELFRSLAVHQAHFYKQFLEKTSVPLPEEFFEPWVEALVYDGLWLTKFPLLFTPTYGVSRLDALQKAAQIGRADPLEMAALRPLIDADIVRFILALPPDDLDARVELFFGGRAMNKPLWKYLLAWFEHSAVFRGRLGAGPDLLTTVFS